VYSRYLINDFACAAKEDMTLAEFMKRRADKGLDTMAANAAKEDMTLEESYKRRAKKGQDTIAAYAAKEGMTLEELRSDLKELRRSRGK
jgi:hypothetical protein